MKIPYRLTAWLLDRLYSVSNRPPDITIGGKDDPYLRRWYVIPRNSFFNIYLHCFMHSDEDRACHDHPYVNMSILLWGQYIECLEAKDKSHWFVLRTSGSVIFRRPTTAHRVILFEPVAGQPSRAWTLFLTGPRVRNWGFLCPQGWRPWQEFTKPGDSSQIGRGCDG